MWLLDKIVSLYYDAKNRKARALRDRERISEYWVMSAEQIYGLSDSEILAVLTMRIGAMVEKNGNGNCAAGKGLLTEIQRNYYIADTFERLVSDGGLLSFFASPYRVLAPGLCDALEAVGAYEHYRLFKAFSICNDIDLDELSYLDSVCDKQKKLELESLKKKFSFEKYDVRYNEIEPIEKYLLKYVRENVNDLL